MNVYHKVYAIFNKKDNSICYVGITKNSLKARLSNHKKSKSSSAYAYMHFYGIDIYDEDFDCEIIDECNIYDDEEDSGYEDDDVVNIYLWDYYQASYSSIPPEEATKEEFIEFLRECESEIKDYANKNHIKLGSLKEKTKFSKKHLKNV